MFSILFVYFAEAPDRVHVQRFCCILDRRHQVSWAKTKSRCEQGANPQNEPGLEAWQSTSCTPISPWPLRFSVVQVHADLLGAAIHAR